MSYEWDKNCAIVDRHFYWQYSIMTTSLIFGTLTLKDLWFMKQNWYADRAKKRLPVVKIY